MNQPVDGLVGCSVLWCDSATHPREAVLHHIGTVASFAGGAVVVRLAWAEPIDGKRTVGPHVQVSKDDPVNAVDPTAEEARVWAGCIDALSEGEVPAFTRALVDAAATLEADEDRPNGSEPEDRPGAEDGRVTAARHALTIASHAVMSGDLGYGAESVVETLQESIEGLLELITARPNDQGDSE